MRRVTTPALVAGGTVAVVAGGAFARSRLKRDTVIPKPVTGTFPNEMAYLRWGHRPEDAAVDPGRPRQLRSEGRNAPEDGPVMVPSVRRAGIHRPVGHQETGHAHGVLETARLIPDCTLSMDEGVGHEGVASVFARDVLDFVGRRPAVEPDRGAEQPTAIDQAAVASEQLTGQSQVGTHAG